MAYVIKYTPPPSHKNPKGRVSHVVVHSHNLEARYRQKHLKVWDQPGLQRETVSKEQQRRAKNRSARGVCTLTLMGHPVLGRSHCCSVFGSSS